MSSMGFIPLRALGPAAEDCGPTGDIVTTAASAFPGANSLGKELVSSGLCESFSVVCLILAMAFFLHGMRPTNSLIAPTARGMAIPARNGSATISHAMSSHDAPKTSRPTTNESKMI